MPPISTDEAAKTTIAAHLTEGRLEEAGPLLQSYRAAYPSDPGGWTLTALWRQLRGEDDAAEQALRTALGHDPASLEACYLLGALYARTGRRDEAAVWYRKALAVADDTTRSVVQEALSTLDATPAPPVRPKLAFIVRAGLDQFLDDLVAGLSPHFEIRKEVVTHLSQIEPVMQWADVCWFEWCDQLLVHATGLELAQHRRIVCRLHRYEVFTAEPSKVQWERVSCLMVVTDHLVGLLRETVPGIEQRVPIEILYNGVDLERYAFRTRGHGHRLAYVGYLHARKNPVLLLQVMAELVARDRRYQLFVAGQFQDPLLQLYWNYQVRELGLEGHVHFEGWKDDVAAWLEDKDYFLSASIHESFGYAIAEAMAMGIKPVVHNFLFARDVWPEEMLYDTVGEAVRMIVEEPYDSRAYRGFIEAQYALDRQVARAKEILDALPRRDEAPDAPMFRPGALRQLAERVKQQGA